MKLTRKKKKKRAAGDSLIREAERLEMAQAAGTEVIRIAAQEHGDEILEDYEIENYTEVRGGSEEQPASSAHNP